MLARRDKLKELLLRELRGAVSAKIEGGADAEEVTADLTERLRGMRQMQQESVTKRSSA